MRRRRLDRRRGQLLWGALLGISCWLVSSFFPAAAQTLTLEQGQQLLQQGQYAEAAEVWQRLVQQGQQTRNPYQTAIAFNYLAIAEQKRFQWTAARQALHEGLQLVETLPDHPDRTAIWARLLNTAGQQALSTGAAAAAVDYWGEAAAMYTRLGDEIGQVGSQINQAIALQSLGFYRRSRQQLETLQARLLLQPIDLQVLGLQQLGIAYRRVGRLPEAKATLERALQKASIPQVAPLRLSLGNVLQDLNNLEGALEQYQLASRHTHQKSLSLKAKLNQLQILAKIEVTAMSPLLQAVQKDLEGLPPSRSNVFARIRYAQSLIRVYSDGRHSGHPPGQYPDQIVHQLNLATQQAQALQDQRAEAFALGVLGSFYEQQKDWHTATALTTTALELANSLNAEDLGARWQWQLGRLAKQQGQLPEAIAAYQASVQLLQNLRQDLATVRDVQFSFTQNVEPVYRELIQLLLRHNPTEQTPSQEHLQAALTVLESLKLQELDNFFHQACLTATAETIDNLDPQAAILYPIILPDRLAVIWARAHGKLEYFETNIDQGDVLAAIEQLRLYLNPAFLDDRRLQLSAGFYDWLVRPTQQTLAANNIKTLVFVLDGPLKTLPMAALHDGKKYLIESYSLAVAPGLSLIDPQRLERQSLSVLAGGLSQSQLAFPALPAVEIELQYIQEKLQGDVLLNNDFTQDKLARLTQTTRFPVLHLATHGQLGSTTEETFLVTWDGLLDAEDLGNLVESRNYQGTPPIELLVLSACQTAAGDARAALGLSGIAVRSGARSTVGTLWQVGDRSTAAAMAQFYQALSQPENSRADALQQAQLSLLADPALQHPFYWAPYVLVGNWL